MSQHDQELAKGVHWLRTQMQSGEKGMAPVREICLTLTNGVPDDLRTMPKPMLAVVQRLAWLGLTKVLDSYTQQREESQWE